MQTLSVAGSTSTLANSCPNSALSSDDFPDFTSPTTTKSNGSRISVSRPWTISSVSGGRRSSVASLRRRPSALSTSLRSCRYCSAIMSVVRRDGRCWRGRRVCDGAAGDDLRLRPPDWQPSRSRSGGFARRLRRFRRRQADQFGDGHELEIFRQQLIDRRRHRFDRSAMNVVREHDRTRARVLHDAIGHRCRSRVFPIERIDIPKNDFVTELLGNPFLLARSDRAVGRPKKSRANSDRAT